MSSATDLPCIAENLVNGATDLTPDEMTALGSEPTLLGLALVARSLQPVAHELEKVNAEVVFELKALNARLDVLTNFNEDNYGASPLERIAKALEVLAHTRSPYGTKEQVEVAVANAQAKQETKPE